MTQKRIYSTLIIAGCIPFVGGALAPYFGVMDLPIIGDLQRAVALYALAIASFMAGTQWGVSLGSAYDDQPNHRSQMCPNRMMVLSNVFVLIPWIVLCVFGINVAYYFSLALMFTLMVLTDYRLMNRNFLSSDYYHMRLIATVIVVICLVSLAFTTI